MKEFKMALTVVVIGLIATVSIVLIPVLIVRLVLHLIG